MLEYAPFSGIADASHWLTTVDADKTGIAWTSFRSDSFVTSTLQIQLISTNTLDNFNAGPSDPRLARVDRRQSMGSISYSGEKGIV
eukprot:7547774-Pyramimonas_sp.AAC.2